MKLHKSLSFFAFALSLAVLFLQQFYAKNIAAVLIHIFDFLFFTLIMAETFLPIREEKYIRKYFQKNAVLCSAVFAFASIFIVLKIKTFELNAAQDLTLIFALFKNIFSAGLVIRKIKHETQFAQKLISDPAKTLIISFLMVIIIGTFLLMLPAASAGSKHLDFLTALFTAASAVCVTGLSTIDAAASLTGIGKLILLVLIQIGGLGIMVFSFFGMLAFRKKLSVSDKLTVSYMVSEDDMTGLFRMLRVIVFSTFFIEALSAVFLFFGFANIFGFGVKAVKYACFHAISAFCNAGFALFSDNLESFTADPLISLPICFTIILGGISFAVIYDLCGLIKVKTGNLFFKKKERYFLSLNAKIVLSMTAVLLLISFSLFYLLEHTNSMKDFSLGKQYLASFFQAVTLRTAGFSTVPFTQLRNSTLLFMIFIMVIGGASGSTAGGLKLNTVAVVAAFFKSFLNNQKTAVIKKMSIPEEQVKKAFLISGFGLCVISCSVFVLTLTEPYDFLLLLFETVSAFATVGLSAGITGKLSTSGQLVIIFLMFIGRVGPLTVLTAAGKKRRDEDIEYPYGNTAIG